MQHGKLTVSRKENWPALLMTTVLAGFFAVAMEWLFFVTQPSFISAFTASEQFTTLVIGAAAVSMLACLPVLVCGLLSGGRVSRHDMTRFLYLLAHVPATAILGSAFLLLLDNFTQTVFSYGIADAVGFTRWVYLAVWVLCLAAGFVLARRVSRSTARAGRARRSGLWLALGLVLLGGLVLRLLAFEPAYAVNGKPQAAAGDASAPRPNVLIIGGDGLNAEHLSVYGYARETTPFLERLAQTSILYENAYSNSAHTGASITTILTGKLPTETKLIYPPDVLQGVDAWQSLPALLRNRGYRTFQSTLRHYADAYDLNFRGAFDYANGRSLTGPGVRAWLEWLAGADAALLLNRSLDRIQARVLHIAGYRGMEDPFAAVTGNEKPRGTSDRERLQAFFEFIAPGAPPFFAQIHLMGTHGARFDPELRCFSAGQTESRDWMRDFYDDAILGFDRLMESLVSALQARGMFDNTLLIVYSDHGMEYKTDVRIPLLVHLPGQDSARRVKRNVQLLDVAATVLDVLNMSRPEWMRGESLLMEPTHAENCEPIFSTTVNNSINVNTGSFWQTVPEPPLFSLGKVGMVVCDRYYEWDLVRRVLNQSVVEGSNLACGACGPLSEAQVRGRIVRHLEQHGYKLDAWKRP